MHWIDASFNRNDCVLATIPMHSIHTGEEIARLIEECIIENGLQLSKIVSIVRDDAPNMVKSCRLLEIERFVYFKFRISIFFVSVFSA